MEVHGVDFILSLTYVGDASELSTSQYWNYTAIWNILDQPTTGFLTGLIQEPNIDKVESSGVPSVTE